MPRIARIVFPGVPHHITQRGNRRQKAYTKIINEREGWRGFLWQGRFSSYPMDETYLYRAMRYDELNPVRAKVVQNAADFPWSSARAHVLGVRDPLLAPNPLGMNGHEWAAYLREGLGESETELFRKHASSASPLGNEDFLRKLGIIT